MTLSIPLQIHFALIHAFNIRESFDATIGQFQVHVEYVDTDHVHCARAEVNGTTWELQNLRHKSEATARVLAHPGLYISWAYQQSSGGINWLQKIETEEKEEGTEFLRLDLSHKPNHRIEEGTIPRSMTV